MPNKRQHNIRIPFRTILSLFLFSVGVFSIMAYPSKIAADTAASDCRNFKLESYKLYSFVDSKYYEGLNNYRNTLCKMVEDGKWNPTKANRTMNSIVIRLALCRDDRINPDHEDYLKKMLKMKDSVIFTYKYFCQTTYDPTKWAGLKFKGLPGRVDWLSVEVFCQWTHEIADPSGFWNTLFKPDLPSVKKFEERTDSICQELRSGKITYSDANYRWQQAFLEYQEKFRPETVKDMGKELEELMKGLADLFMKFAK